MEKFRFSIEINAPAGKVWQVLWNDATYRKWTSVFTEGSYAVSNWKEGSKVLFLSPEGSGMFSVIDTMRENEFMSFKHLGEIKNNIEQPPTDTTSAWYGATENYTLTEHNGTTTLAVAIDLTEKEKDYFNIKLPEALQLVKTLSEN